MGLKAVDLDDEFVLRPVEVDLEPLDVLVEVRAGEAGVDDEGVGEPFGDGLGVEQQVGVLMQAGTEAGGAGMVLRSAAERFRRSRART